MTNFLTRLKKEGKLELVEPSTDICDSYSKKASDCLKSAKLLLDNDLYENSIGQSYYAMYDQLQGLLFKTGIKCENHSGSILLLKTLYGEKQFSEMISTAKKERIDKQYYVNTDEEDITKEIAKELLFKAEKFILKIRTMINLVDNNKIKTIRKKLESL